LNSVVLEHSRFETRLHFADETPRLVNLAVGAALAQAAFEIDLQGGHPFAQSIDVVVTR
jgi:hypothetical protein